MSEPTRNTAVGLARPAELQRSVWQTQAVSVMPPSLIESHTSSLVGVAKQFRTTISEREMSISHILGHTL